VDENELDPEDPVVVLRLRPFGDHLSRELHHAPEGTVLDLDSLVHLAVGGRRLAVAGEDQLRALELDLEVVDVDAARGGSEA